MSQRAFDVWVFETIEGHTSTSTYKRHVTTVFFDSDMSAPKVKRSLVDREGFPSTIWVTKRRSSWTRE